MMRTTQSADERQLTMHLNKSRIPVAITGLTLLASTDAIPVLAKSIPSESLKNLPAVVFLSQRLLDSSGNEINPTGLDCNNIPFDARIETPEGIQPISIYCQAEFNNRRQSAANNQTKPSWQKLYWQNGNVCRERGADTVCLTPQEATNLRWLTPSQ